MIIAQVDHSSIENNNLIIKKSIYHFAFIKNKKIFCFVIAEFESSLTLWLY